MFQNSEENKNQSPVTVVPSKEEHQRSKYGAYFVMKVLLVVLCVLVVALLALVAKGFSSLKSLNERVKTVENGKSLKLEHGKGGSEQNPERNCTSSVQNRSLPGQPGLSQDPKESCANVGVTYIRWGKTTCPSITEATLVYEGYVGGSHYLNSGGGANYVCLSREPIYENTLSGRQDYNSRIYGAEYESGTFGIYPDIVHNHDVPCAVCHVTKRTSQIMIPGRNVCPTGWTHEYKGYLMAERHNYHRTTYTCMDGNPDYSSETHVSKDGALFHFVEAICGGSLPCTPYIDGQELTCAVCTL